MGKLPSDIPYPDPLGRNVTTRRPLDRFPPCADIVQMLKRDGNQARSYIPFSTTVLSFHSKNRSHFQLRTANPSFGSFPLLDTV